MLHLQSPLTKDILRSHIRKIYCGREKDNISKTDPCLVIAYLDFALCV